MRLSGSEREPQIGRQDEVKRLPLDVDDDIQRHDHEAATSQLASSDVIKNLLASLLARNHQHISFRATLFLLPMPRR